MFSSCVALLLDPSFFRWVFFVIDVKVGTKLADASSVQGGVLPVWNSIFTGMYFLNFSDVEDELDVEVCEVVELIVQNGCE